MQILVVYNNYAPRVHADASVEVAKLHNIKLLIVIHTLIIIIMMNIFNFTACKIQRNSGK